MDNSQKRSPEHSAESSERTANTERAERTKGTESTERTESRNPALRAILLIAGTLCVVIGIIGIYLPVLPTTPFLLLAAACYVRSSERMYHWLLAQPRFGREVQTILEKRGLPRKVKIVSLVFAWIMLGGLALFVVESSWAKALLLALAVIKTGVLMRMPTVD